MRQGYFFLAILLSMSFEGIAQVPKNGFIILNDSTKLEGEFQENFKKNNSIEFINAAGKKMIFKAESVRYAEIDSTMYISFKNEYYEIVTSGTKISLLQKVTKITDKVYFIWNGANFLPSNYG